MTVRRKTTFHYSSLRPCHFTLVELLVVTSIMSILAMLLMPALQKSLFLARGTSCTNQLKQFGIAATMYSNDFRVIPCPRINISATGYQYEWAEAFSLYLSKDYRLYQCPSRSGSPNGAPSPYWQNSSYSCNRAFERKTGSDAFPRRYSEIHDPAGTLYIADGVCGRTGYTYTWAWEGILWSSDRVDFRHGISPILTLGVTNYSGNTNMLCPAGNVRNARYANIPTDNSGCWTLSATD